MQLNGHDSVSTAQLELIDSESYLLEKKKHKRASFCKQMLGLQRQIWQLYIEWESSLELLVSSYDCLSFLDKRDQLFGHEEPTK